MKTFHLFLASPAFLLAPACNAEKSADNGGCS